MEKKKVLYISDDSLMILFVQRVLEKERPDLEYNSAFSAEEGQDLIRKNPPDFIILNLDLPNGEGRSFLKWIQANDLLKHIPVIGEISPVIQGDPLLLPAPDVYLGKPVGIDQLLNAVKKAIDKIEY